ncbi:MAG: aminoacetone oxidase family FAD-binding enzyme [Bacteroidales bacterium]|nr:aminoacetone oxidase family FAD-binding enzyme [Bacteroidales bacterium]
MQDIVVIGAGAAGCFCAAEMARLRPDLRVSVFEAAARPMMKLAVTGGGRCNITNSFEWVASLADVYPRGDKLMKRLLHSFGPEDCLRWFGDRGVRFVTQPDGCVFPASQDAMQIVRTLERAMRDGGVRLFCGRKVTAVDSDLTVRFSDAASKSEGTFHPDAVVLTTGGATARLLAGTGIELVPDVPSLFTLKLADEGLRSLMGTVVDNVTLGLTGTRFRSQGTLLLTDWGVSGPATLRLSSYAARHLAENQYRGTLMVNWMDASEAEVRERLTDMSGSGRTVSNSHPAELSERLWKMLVGRACIRPDARWSELGSKGLAKLINILIADTYEITGRARFKEEFVTCGGVAFSEVRPDTLEARRIPGLYFAGEVLDIDAVTGGFNLQAAWTTAHTVAHAVADSI